MQNLITEHTNPMKQKRPFIKKSRDSNLSFISKPNLSITKASNRFSFDKTLTCPSYRQQSYIKTARDTHHEFTYPQVLQQLQHPQTARASLGNQNYGTTRRRSSFQVQRRNCHKQKLREILQSIDMNNTMIEELFECDEEISFFKDEIKKTLDIYQDFHSQISRQVKSNQKDRENAKEPYTMQQRNHDTDTEELCNKIQQLRMKKGLFRDQREQGSRKLSHQSLNQTFT